MPEINELVLKKLRKYPKPISDLAIEAVRAASELPKSAVREQLEAAIRKAARAAGGKV